MTTRKRLQHTKPLLGRQGQGVEVQGVENKIKKKNQSKRMKEMRVKKKESKQNVYEQVT